MDSAYARQTRYILVIIFVLMFYGIFPEAKLIHIIISYIIIYGVTLILAHIGVGKKE